MTHSQRLLLDLEDTAVPLERRAWRFREYVRRFGLTVDAVESLLRQAPKDLREFYRGTINESRDEKH